MMTMSTTRASYIARLILGFALLLGGAAQAQSLNLQQVTQKMEKARDGVEDIQAKAQFEFRLNVGILPYNDTLYGSYFFKKPDRHKLDFPDAPSYLKSVPSMFSWKLPGADKYNAKVSGPSKDNGQRIYTLLFLPKNPTSKTASITMIVDAVHWRVSRQDTRYKDGGSVLLTFSYTQQNKLPLLEKVAGQIDIPAYSLKGNAAISLSAQKVNQGVDDSVFNGQ